MPEKRAKPSVAAQDVVVSFRETVTEASRAEARNFVSTTASPRSTRHRSSALRKMSNGRQSNITPGQVSLMQCLVQIREIMRN